MWASATIPERSPSLIFRKRKRLCKGRNLIDIQIRQEHPTMDGEALSSCVVITGASRGLGRAIAVEFAKLPSVRSLLLIARNNLEATKEDCLHHRQLVNKEEDLSGTLCVTTIHADLGNLETLDETIVTIYEKIVQEQQELDFGRLILVNNAGSLGYIGQAAEMPSLRDMQDTIDLNVTSALWMAVRMISTASTFPRPASVLIVNISSLVAIQPFPSLALYSAGKAARDAFFKAMATEHPAPPSTTTPTPTTTTNITTPTATIKSVKTLNYAPGPLETDMTQEIRAASSSERLNESLRPHYAKQLVQPIDSARVLVDLVQKDEFDSGEHIDYFDVVASQQDSSSSSTT
jgi:sepiapterin reductase